MEKIAFVAVRYGKDINGGAEFHCRMLAERLVGKYEVEVLTTCVKDYTTGDNEFPEGEERYNGVLIRRFNAEPVDREQHGRYMRKAKKACKLRFFLYNCGLLAPISFLFPVWTYRREYELKALNSSVFYSPRLFTFIKEHKKDYKVIIPISLDYPQLYYTALYASEKALLIPTMHKHRVSFRSILTEAFTKAAYVGFNTTAEERLGERIFGPRMAPHGIVSVGLELASPADWQTVSVKYDLPEEYLLYVGRVDCNKLHRIFEYFSAYKLKYEKSNLKLVLLGGIFTEQKEYKDVRYLGFVGEHEKTVIMQHAKIVVNPSKYESLSLILLEAMSLGKPVLVNGLCNVLREHCVKSRRAAFPYFSKRDFIKKLHKLDVSAELRKKTGEKGVSYVKDNYNWDLILRRLEDAINYVSRKS